MPANARCVHAWSHGTHGDDSPIPATLWSARSRPAHFSFTNAPRCLKLLLPPTNAIFWLGGRGGHCWIVAGMSVGQKRLIHASQIAAHKTLFAAESLLLLCYVTCWGRRGEWEFACTQNTCCFVPYGKLTSVCVFKIVMADWNSSNHFDTHCIIQFTVL
jgi:hypothetical protein